MCSHSCEHWYKTVCGDEKFLLRGNIPSVVCPLGTKRTVALSATISTTAQCVPSIHYVWQGLTYWKCWKNHVTRKCGCKHAFQLNKFQEIFVSSLPNSGSFGKHLLLCIFTVISCLGAMHLEHRDFPPEKHHSSQMESLSLIRS